MANIKLSEARVTNPPTLPLSGAELLFLTQYNEGADTTVIATLTEVLAGPAAAIAAANAAIATKSPIGHTHTIANVTGLQTALDGKSPVGHTHNYVDKAGDTMTGSLGVPGGMRMSGNISGAGAGVSVFEFSGGRYIGYNYGADRLDFSGFPQVTLTGSYWSQGSGAAFFFQDRSTAAVWAWYAQAGVARLNHQAFGDRFFYYESGEFRPVGGIDTGSSEKIKHSTKSVTYTLDQFMEIKPFIGRYKESYSPDQRERAFFSTENFKKVGITEPLREGTIDFEGEKVDAMQYEQTIPLLAHFLQLAVAELRDAKQQIADLTARVDGIAKD